MKTKDRFAQDLERVGAPEQMIEWAKNGFYDDYESVTATPIIQLVVDCDALGLNEIADKARNGEYDGTKEEAEAWANKEGRRYLDKLKRRRY